jgi:hypothetical protein
MSARWSIWLAAFLVIGCAFGACAEPVTLATAQEAAKRFLESEQSKSDEYRRAVGVPATARPENGRLLASETSGDSLAYVFELEPAGYLVMSKDTELAPIIAYSYSGTFSWEEVEGNILLHLLRQDMTYRLQAARDGAVDAAVVAENIELWDVYRGARSSSRATYSPKVYGPWTLNPWHQKSPYNADCPMDPVTSVRCVVGCVATALAQILNYWQYPTAVSFSDTDDYVTDTRGISIDASTANFTGLNYNGCNPSDAAKADLSFAAGVSVQMDYTSTGSGAMTAMVAPALAGSWYPWSGPAPQRWGYQSADLRTSNPTYSWWGSPYYTTETSFFAQLSSNMMQARPAELAITDGYYGHAIVVDGWKSEREYHLNYGWGPNAYGWYALPAGMPSGYNVIKYVVLNIVPTASTYTMTTASTGSGVVHALPSGGTLTAGTHVIVSAIPTAGCYFDHWTGDLTGSENPATLILDENKSVTAVFGGTSGTVSTKKWTVLVYMAADNNLGGGTPDDPDFMDIDEMETAAISCGGAANIVVLWDKPGLNNTAIYWIQPDAIEGSLATYTLNVNLWPAPGGPEENMGEETTLTDFLDWVSDKFASDYYALILWNHGGGWEPRSAAIPEKEAPIEHTPAGGGPPDLGICWDDTDGSDYLTTKEIASGIRSSTFGSVDNLGMDACLMQMLTVAYEARTVASYLTASEETEGGYGWAYDQALGPITATTTPLQLALSWGTTRSDDVDTISSLDLSKVGALATAVSSLAARLTTLLGTSDRYYEILEAKLLHAISFASPEFVDLDELCLSIKAFVNDATASNLATAVRTAITSAVVAKSNAPTYATAGGIAIYFPHYHEIFCESVAHADYRGDFFAFCADHSWDEFLNAWLATDYADPYEENNSPATAYDLGTYYGSWSGLLHEADFDDDDSEYTDDWYKFTASHAFSMDLQALCTEYYSDTVLYVFDSLANANGGTYFAADDDGGYGYGSRVIGSSLAPGTYYIKVASYFWNDGVDEDYALFVDIDQPTPAVFRVESGGDVRADGSVYAAGLLSGSADVAEWVSVSGPVEPGTVLELNPEQPGAYRPSQGACSLLVGGVVSSEPGMVLGGTESAEGYALLALSGIVPVKVTNEGGPIQPGDLLVSSSTPGYAMRWAGPEPCPCALVGKALEAMTGEQGVISVLLTAH